VNSPPPRKYSVCAPAGIYLRVHKWPLEEGQPQSADLNRPVVTGCAQAYPPFPPLHSLTAALKPAEATHNTEYNGHRTCWQYGHGTWSFCYKTRGKAFHVTQLYTKNTGALRIVFGSRFQQPTPAMFFFVTKSPKCRYRWSLFGMK
jgi:hypothetical protein